MITKHGYSTYCPLCENGHHDYSREDYCICCKIEFRNLPKVEFS